VPILRRTGNKPGNSRTTTAQKYNDAVSAIAAVVMRLTPPVGSRGLHRHVMICARWIRRRNHGGATTPILQFSGPGDESWLKVAQIRPIAAPTRHYVAAALPSGDNSVHGTAGPG
jgi:hypothetical protein